MSEPNQSLAFAGVAKRALFLFSVSFHKGAAMFRVTLLLLFSLCAVSPFLVGCGPSQVNDEEAASQATDDAGVESPQNDAENP
jgi:hypothetical protein